MPALQFTVDPLDDGSDGWACVQRDQDNMPVEEWHYPDRLMAARGAANRRYAAKTIRPAIRRMAS